ncbi:lipopolysaccharide assembly protein LapA domain-containing protein [Rubellimicrobium arenae]|uniref:lipopolysaccharide assembly protein LapA domain-containing protein n=1 Tax=Rubellimicrobium arenae TaxID=2817372 RepID=UPI001B30F265|nr:lipopolysaccharide assembly protein LapA domain-containing protein [Rubellimicrobium arenae]
MRFLKTAFWGLVAVILVTMGLANRGIVTLRVLPEAFSTWLGVSPDIDLPLFLVILLGVALGLLVGFIWEWIREIPERAQGRATARELERLRREVARQRAEAAPRNDVLAAIEAPVVPARR